MANGVEAITWAGLNSNHFPLEPTTQLKLGGRPKHNRGKARTRYDFRSLKQEEINGLDEGCDAITEAVRRESSVEGAWATLRDGVKHAMEEHVPKMPQKPKRAWISADAMELVEHRKALAEAGLI